MFSAALCSRIYRVWHHLAHFWDREKGVVTSNTLTSLRHSMLTKKVVSATSFVTPERLPPTASATKYHSLRVYYQIMTWMGKETSLDATDWGWKTEANQFIPVMTDRNAAPDNLLKVVHCNCTTGCSTQRCTCRQYGLPCTSACGQCQLDSCNNPHNRSQAMTMMICNLWYVTMWH